MDVQNFTKRALSASIFLLALGHISQSVAAITYTADNRYLYYTVDSNSYLYTENTYPDAPYADFNEYSDQTSSLSSSGFTALGAGSRAHEEEFNYDSYRYWSYFDISFNLDTNSVFDLSGELKGANDNDSYFVPGHADTGDATASVTLYSGSSIDPANILFSESISVEGSLETLLFSYNDILSAGDYRFRVVADPERINNNSDYTYAWSSYDLTANVSAVPVPAAAWLFASGLLCLARVASRKT